jgi:hypothetical protein
MGSFSNYMENAVIDALRNTALQIATVYMSLHTADPGETGSNEVTGGSYARQAMALDAASGGASANTAQEEIASMPACTVAAIGMWDALTNGNFIGFGWMGGHSAKVFTSATDDTVTSPGHGYSDTDQIVFSAEDAGTLPTGVTAGTIYFVRDSATNTFKVAATSGGAAIDLTTVGSGKVRKVVPKTVNSGDTFRVAAGDFDLQVF